MALGLICRTLKNNEFQKGLGLMRQGNLKTKKTTPLFIQGQYPVSEAGPISLHPGLTLSARRTSQTADYHIFFRAEAQRRGERLLGALLRPH